MKNIRFYLYWFLDALKGASMKKTLNDIRYINENYAKCGDIIYKRTTELLQHAKNTTKFYSAISSDVLEDFPVVNKNIYKERYEEFLSSKFEKKTLHKMSTSGSTGIPFAVYQNAAKRNRVLAELIYYNMIIGQNIGDKYIFFRVWTEENKKSFFTRFKTNLVPIDITCLDNDNLERISEYLQKKHIKSALGYVSTFEILYKYYENKKYSPDNFKLDTAICGSEVLSDYTAKGIKRALGCSVINRYSNQENGVLAQSTINSFDLLINSANYIIEILKADNDEAVDDGEIGRIVITDLFNYAMPMIRYDTGDLGVKTMKNGTPVLESVQGRRVDIIYNTKGEILSPHIFGVHMWKYEKFNQWQFVQESMKGYTLNINSARDYYNDLDIIEHLRSVLGEDAEIKINHVNGIPALASGKFKRTICNYLPGKAD